MNVPTIVIELKPEGDAVTLMNWEGVTMTRLDRSLRAVEKEAMAHISRMTHKALAEEHQRMLAKQKEPGDVSA